MVLQFWLFYLETDLDNSCLGCGPCIKKLGEVFDDFLYDINVRKSLRSMTRENIIQRKRKGILLLVRILYYSFKTEGVELNQNYVQ